MTLNELLHSLNQGHYFEALQCIHTLMLTQQKSAPLKEIEGGTSTDQTLNQLYLQINQIGVIGNLDSKNKQVHWARLKACVFLYLFGVSFDLIKKHEYEDGSVVFYYELSDQQHPETQVAMRVHRLFFDYVNSDFVNEVNDFITQLLRLSIRHGFWQVAEVIINAKRPKIFTTRNSLSYRSNRLNFMSRNDTGGRISEPTHHNNRQTGAPRTIMNDSGAARDHQLQMMRGMNANLMATGLLPLGYSTDALPQIGAVRPNDNVPDMSSSVIQQDNENEASQVDGQEDQSNEVESDIGNDYHSEYLCNPTCLDENGNHIWTYLILSSKAVRQDLMIRLSSLEIDINQRNAEGEHCIEVVNRANNDLTADHPVLRYLSQTDEGFKGVLEQVLVHKDQKKSITQHQYTSLSLLNKTMAKKKPLSPKQVKSCQKYLSMFAKQLEKNKINPSTHDDYNKAQKQLEDMVHSSVKPKATLKQQ